VGHSGFSPPGNAVDPPKGAKPCAGAFARPRALQAGSRSIVSALGIQQSSKTLARAGACWVCEKLCDSASLRMTYQRKFVDDFVAAWTKVMNADRFDLPT